ncbi:MAG: tetratricopeptide repeat protein [Spirochaetales bacterium]|nr:tetratricopeptide repeat protein [Spirochaetales bacterium]
MSYTFERGKRLYEAKRYDLALKEFRGTGIDASENLEFAYFMGLTLTQLEHYDDALMYLEQIVSTHRSFVHVYQCRMILGYIYAKTRRFRLAEFEFLKTIEGGVRSRQVYASLGHICYLLRKVDESIKNLRHSLSLDAEYPNALNSLGFIYAEEEIDKEKALHLCKKAVNISPNNPSYLDSLGWAHFKIGRPFEAQGYLRKALELLPKNKEISRHLKIVTSSL